VSYVSLYRKYRPQTLEEVVGQDHITHTLSNALKRNMISHAYLFCGPRGTGKTSVAKILAKALNCEKGPTPIPCNKCDACLQINNGSFVDVLEIDAASNRGIDEIRDLREKIHFLPADGRVKVYIIDEVHMLTREAFNALLKTLEEPPSHVVFVLATTEPHKVLPTILSRCQRFDFKIIHTSDMVVRLLRVAKAEGINVEERALPLIARHAQGSLRDALGTMDQLSSFTGKEIKVDDVVSLLGMSHAELLFETVEILLKRDVTAIFEFVERLVESGRDPRQFTKDLIEYIRALFIIKNANEANEIVNVTPEAFAKMGAQAACFQESGLMRFLDVLSVVHGQMRWDPDARLALEMTLMKLTRPETDSSLEGLLCRVEELERIVVDRKSRTIKEETGNLKGGQVTDRTIVEGKTRTPKVVSDAKDEPEKLKREEKKQSEKPGSNNLKSESEKKKAEDEKVKSQSPSGNGSLINTDKVKRAWPIILNKVKEKKISTYALLLECQSAEVEESDLVLKFNRRAGFHKGEIEKPQNLELIRKSLEETLGFKAKIKCVLEKGGAPGPSTRKEEKKDDDEILDGEKIVDLLQRDFDAEITEENSSGKH